MGGDGVARPRPSRGLTLCSSFRRKPESSVFAPLLEGEVRFHSACGRAGYFLLRGQEKVTKEKATPASRPRAAREGPLRFSAGRGCSDSASVHCFAVAAIPRRDPSGISRPACDARRAAGDRIKSQDRARATRHPLPQRSSRSCGWKDQFEILPSTQCRDARLSGQRAPYAVPSIAAFAGSARRGAARDRRACEAVHGCTV